MISLTAFKKILNRYWIKAIGDYIPNNLVKTFYQAYLKAYVRKKVSAEDFIEAFFIYIGKGKGLFINKKI